MEFLLGSFNFACRVVAPGRAFGIRLIHSTIGFNKPHYSIRKTSNIKADVLMWKSLLKNNNGLTLMPDIKWTSNVRSCQNRAIHYINLIEHAQI